LHSYVWIEAARSFNQALRIDPALAIAHAELAIAYTELNAPEKARAALDRARTLPAGEHDKTHIELRALQTSAEAAPRDAAKLAPGVPHARHMHGHNLRRTGRIDEAIAEFSAADALESAYLEAERIPVEYDWHYQHNLDLLAASYQYVGRMKKAEELLRRSF